MIWSFRREHGGFALIPILAISWYKMEKGMFLLGWGQWFIIVRKNK